MKAEIHPQYTESVITCACGNRWTTRSTKPQMHIEACSQCHPFFTGEQRLIDTAGRVERFRRRYAKSDQARAQEATGDAPQATTANA